MACCTVQQSGNRIDALTVDLLARDLVNVQDPLAAVNSCDLAFALGETATSNEHLVVLAHGDRANLPTANQRFPLKISSGTAAYVVLLAELLRKRCAHNHTAHRRRRGEMRLARLAPRRADVLVELR